MQVEVAVVGRGMVGSAAARHLAEGGCRTALIGGSEPADYAAAGETFASHYDEARITRIGAPDPVWADLAAASIGRYGDIAARSGIGFYQSTGLVFASLTAETTMATSIDRGGEAKPVSDEWVRSTWGIRLPQDADLGAVYEAAPAGVIRPRQLVTAQAELARQAGATLIQSAATSVTRTPTGFEIVAGGDAIGAERILLATGAYGTTLVGAALETDRLLRTVAAIELEGAEPDLPCLIVERPAGSDATRLYWTPPIRYPDGRMRLKVGASVLPLRQADSPADIAAWFAAGGDQHEVDVLVDAVRELLPSASVLSTVSKPCVMTATTSERPFIGLIDDGIAVALGGNGGAAKSSDEIGRLGATIIDPTRHGAEDLSPFAPRLVSP